LAKAKHLNYSVKILGINNKKWDTTNYK
jgi:hypothetical protein